MRSLSGMFCAAALAACATTAPSAPETPSAPALVVDDARVDAVLRSFTESGQIVGVSTLIYQHGQETYFGAFGYADREAQRPMTRDTIAQIYSMTKPVVGVALMMLYEEGKFSLDDPLSRHAPDFASMRVYAGIDAAGAPIYEAPRREITTRDVMNHTAGFSGGGLAGPLRQMVIDADAGNLEITLPEMARRLASIPLEAHPGEKWIYGPSVEVQAYLVERLSGVPFAQFLQQRIFDPLQMRETRYFVPESDRARLAVVYARNADGTFERIPEEQGLRLNTRDWPMKPGGFGLTSTLDDYMRFARMLVNEGELDGVRILRPETVRLMATDTIAHITERSFLPSKGQLGFGLDFAVRTALAPNTDEGYGAIGEFYWDGAANTLFWVDPESDLTAVMFAQYFPPWSTPLHVRLRNAIYGVAEAAP